MAWKDKLHVCQFKKKLDREFPFLSPLSFGQNEEEPLEYKILSNDNEIDAWLIASKIKLCPFF